MESKKVKRVAKVTKKNKIDLIPYGYPYEGVLVPGLTPVNINDYKVLSDNPDYEFTQEQKDEFLDILINHLNGEEIIQNILSDFENKNYEKELQNLNKTLALETMNNFGKPDSENIKEIKLKIKIIKKYIDFGKILSNRKQKTMSLVPDDVLEKVNQMKAEKELLSSSSPPLKNTTPDFKKTLTDVSPSVLGMSQDPNVFDFQNETNPAMELGNDFELMDVDEEEPRGGKRRRRKMKTRKAVRKNKRKSSTKRRRTSVRRR